MANTLDKLRNWLSFGTKAAETTEPVVTVPQEIVSTVRQTLIDRKAEQKVMDIANLIAAEEPLAWKDVSAIVEFYWGGSLDPEDYGFIGERGDGKALQWWTNTVADFENTAVKANPTSSFKVFRDQKGNPRWFGWVSNNWIDREKEIIAATAHKEFIQWLDKNPENAPELWSWHTRGTARTARADWWDYANGFLIMSGPLTEAEAKAYEKLGERELGMSHGFYVIRQAGPIILKYRTFEVSDLDRKHAANPYTAIEVILGENKMFSDTKRAYLIDLFGEDVVSELETKTQDMEKALEDLGITRKDFDEKYIEYLEAEATAKADASVETQVNALLEQIKEALNVEQLRDILHGFGEDLEELKGLRETVGALQADITALKETEDQRISSLFAPRQPLDWSKSASQAAETVVDEKDLDEEIQAEAKEANEQFSWLKGMAVKNI